MDFFFSVWRLKFRTDWGVCLCVCVFYSFCYLKKMCFFFLSFYFPIGIKNKNKKLQLSRIFLNWLLSNMNHGFVFKYLSVFSGTLIKYKSLLRPMIIRPAGRNDSLLLYSSICCKSFFPCSLLKL